MRSIRTIEFQHFGPAIAAFAVVASTLLQLLLLASVFQPIMFQVLLNPSGAFPSRACQRPFA